MSKRKGAKPRRNACPICREPRRQSGLPLTVPFGLPTYWSPNEALAIFEFVDEMRDLIVAVYGPRLSEAACQNRNAPTDSASVIPDDELPF